MKIINWKIIRRLWVLAGLCFTAWLYYSSQAHGVKESVFQNNELVRVTQTPDVIVFTPIGAYKKVVIFYPGALVQTEAYGPLCRQISEAGFQVLLFKMPWRLASKGYNKPKELGILTDTSKQYILAGHSQGAKMAAQFVYENPGLVSQLVLLGTTHPRDIDLSGSSIPVLKISGTNDGVADIESVIINKPKLPPATRYVEITGGNHSQFGYYGFQLGDHEADISRAEQQRMVLEEILSFLR